MINRYFVPVLNNKKEKEKKKEKLHQNTLNPDTFGGGLAVLSKSCCLVALSTFKWVSFNHSCLTKQEIKNQCFSLLLPLPLYSLFIVQVIPESPSCSV